MSCPRCGSPFGAWDRFYGPCGRCREVLQIMAAEGLINEKELAYAESLRANA